MEDYNEEEYKELSEYVNEMLCDTEDYCREYPRNFYEFRENANYHSYDSYSIWEQYDIAVDWERYRDENVYESSDEDDE